MPMRLPDALPAAIEASWGAGFAAGEEQLSLSLDLADFAPPGTHTPPLSTPLPCSSSPTHSRRLREAGVLERLLAACHGLGAYHSTT
jgi:hypothetical protein